MTDPEREMLAEIHAALFKPPTGAGEHERPLIEDIRAVVSAYKKASWVTRAIIWGLPALAAMGASIQWFVHLVRGSAE